jgi:hypothetical protein
MDEDDTPADPTTATDPAAAPPAPAAASEPGPRAAAEMDDLMGRMHSVLSVLPTSLLERCVASRRRGHESTTEELGGGGADEETASVQEVFRIADGSMCLTGKCEMFA